MVNQKWNGVERRGEDRTGAEGKGMDAIIPISSKAERSGEDRRGRERNGKEGKGKERKGREGFLLHHNSQGERYG